MVKRKSAILSPSSLGCLSHIPTINVTSGCAHGCFYCYTRGYSRYPGQAKVEVFENILDKLKAELPRKKTRPRAVYFSPSSDIFQPVPEVLELAYGIFEYLLKMGVGVAFLTKGEIPAKHMKLIEAHAENVRAGVGLIAMEERILKTFEPHAASAEKRLAQIKKLIKAGVRTQVRLDPIIPGLTDREIMLRRLLEAIGKAGVKNIAASVLFLRPAIVASLKEHWEDKEALNNLLSSFSKAKRFAIHAEHSSVVALPLAERQAILNKVNAIALEFGIGVKTCACKNPDLANGTCSIAGDWIHPPKQAAQLSLFGNPERSG